MKWLADVFYALLFYFILIIAHGYVFGGNDQMDFMPYTRHLQEQSMFSGDFYINCIENKFNERYVLSHLIALIPHTYWKISFVCIHLFFTVILLLGLLKWCDAFVEKLWLKWLVISGTLIVGYHYTLGGNELYYNMVCGSGIAKAIGIWALWSAYKQNWILAILLSVAATYFQPIAGFQIIILSCFLSENKHLLKQVVISALLLSPYVYSLISDLNSGIQQNDFVQIMQLRNAHHFFPLQFGVKNYVVLIPLFLAGSYFWFDRDRKIFWLCCTIITGCLVYTVGIYILPKATIMSQWFKTTIWLKFFSLLSLFQFVSTKIWIHKYRIPLMLLPFFVVLLKYGIRITRDFEWNPLAESLQVRYAKEIKTKTNPKDLLLVSPDFTELKYFAERSTFVDWKAIPHNGECLKEWTNRIQISYGLKLDTPKSLNSIYKEGNSFLKNLPAENKKLLKEKGVTKIVLLDAYTGYKIIGL